MTVTRDDLETRRVWIEVDGAEWREVSYKDQHFLLCVSNYDHDTVVELVKEYMPFALIYMLAGEDEAVKMFRESMPELDTAVFPATLNEATGEFEMKYECDGTCSGNKGMCNKRLAQRHDVADMEIAYSLLLDALNA